MKDVFLMSCVENKLRLVERMLESCPPDIDLCDSYDNTALLYSCIQNNTKMVKMLVDAGASIRKCDVLFYSCIENNTDIIEILVKYGRDIEYMDLCRCLLVSCRHNNSYVVRLLIDRGADIDHRDTFGTTPLLIACENNNYELCEYLIHKGADVNLRTNLQNSTVSFAIENSNERLISLLVESKVELEYMFDYIDFIMVIDAVLAHKVIDVMDFTELCRITVKDRYVMDKIDWHLSFVDRYCKHRGMCSKFLMREIKSFLW